MPESEIFKQISMLSTEQNNQNSADIDLCDSIDILKIINEEDKKVALAVEKELANIAKAVDGIVDRFKQGGRLFYFGAGTSGRIGVLDASECPPTFGTDPELVQGKIAGGKEAMFVAQEGAEDSPEVGANEVEQAGLTDVDIACGIAASGRTPYVRGALSKASELGCMTIMVTTAGHQAIQDLRISADIVISPEVGAEVVAGSTRMKSGTAQKMVLNMLTTASMIRLGKTYGNVMVDLKQSNIKLRERSKNILMNICDINYEQAEELLIASNNHVKTAIVMSLLGCTKQEAANRLAENDGFIKRVVEGR